MSKKTSRVQVRLLTSVVRLEDGRQRTYQDGDVYECTADEAKRMIANDRAVAIESKAEAKDTD